MAKNTPLILGLIIVAIVMVIAFAGPSLAPRNPLEEKRVIQVEDEWFTAPYPPLKVPGYPLGSDSNGRDILSQMLWALRPTLMLVSAVALIRLLIGTFFGMLAGWFKNRFGTLISNLINAGLALPSLIIALIIVALAGTNWQPWGFVLGLCITGWADSARLIREQTSITREQLFIEASRALGQKNFGIIIQHVLRQVAPYVWMLFAFEIGSTLLVTAGLGFLGYYVGGEVWVWISDTQAARLSGMPELGQMLSGVSEDIYTSPWKLFASGTLIFITVLGFNMLGEGLRRNANRGVANSSFLRFINPLRFYLENNVWMPLKGKMYSNPIAGSLIFITLITSVVLLTTFIINTLRPKPIDYSAPGGQLWASQWGDPTGTMHMNASGIESPRVLWSFTEENGFTGGPVVNVEGSVYLLTKNGTLYAINPQGEVTWSKSIGADGVGTPALDADGNIYVTDIEGRLTSFTPNGELRWQLQVEDSFEATSGPIATASGKIYYVVIGDVRAVSAGGELLWQTTAFSRRFTSAPIISPNEDFVFLRNTILDANTGEVITFELLPTTEQYIVGLNGLFYARFESRMTAWEYINGEAQPRNQMNWSRTAFFGFTDTVGVLADGSVWLHYNSEYEDSTLLWLDKRGNMINRARFAYRPTKLAGIDEDFVFYICGSNRNAVECAAVPLGMEIPKWTLPLEKGTTVAGLALVPNRLYVATAEGYFYAIGNP